MSAAPNTTPKKHHRKGPRNDRAQSSSEAAPATNATSVEPDLNNLGFFQPNGQYQIPVEDNTSLQALEPRKSRRDPKSTPNTKPKHRKQKAEASKADDGGSNGRSKKPKPAQATKDTAYSSDHLASSPSSRSAKQNTRNPSTVSPMRASASKTPPVSAYAGPTFHASPAASSLPIPKFFAKSMPLNLNEDGTPDSLGDDSSDTVPESPTRANYSVQSIPTRSESPTRTAQTAKSGPARNESPLEIFFRADRENRARAQRENDLPIDRTSSRSDNSNHRRAASSPYGAHRPSGSTSTQQSTGRPSSGVFALDMSGNSSSSSSPTHNMTSPNPRSITLRADSAPSVPSAVDGDEERRQAGAQALKAILSKSSERPATASGQYGRPVYEMDGAPINPSSTDKAGLGLPQRAAALEPKNQFPQYSTTSPSHEQKAAKTAQRQSGLRQEINSPAESKRADSPSTYVLQGRVENVAPLDANAIARKYLDEQLNAPRHSQLTSKYNSSSTSTVFYPLAVSSTQQSQQSNHLMEENIRRMLNLEGPASAPSVRN